MTRPQVLPTRPWLKVPPLNGAYQPLVNLSSNLPLALSKQAAHARRRPVTPPPSSDPIEPPPSSDIESGEGEPNTEYESESAHKRRAKGGAELLRDALDDEAKKRRKRLSGWKKYVYKCLSFISS